MRRAAICVLICFTAGAQPPRVPPDPVADAIKEYWAAHKAGRVEEAVAKREESRRLFEQMQPFADKNWIVAANKAGPFGVNKLEITVADHAWVIANEYSNNGYTVRGRVFLEKAWRRTDTWGEANPTRIILASRLAAAWGADGNYAKAAEYQEKVVAALEKEKKGPAHTIDVPSAFNELIHLYESMGKRRSARAVLERMRANNPSANGLQEAYRKLGMTGQAADVYRTQIAEVDPDPKAKLSQRIEPREKLGLLYRDREQFAQAAVELRGAVALLNGSPEQEGYSRLCRELAGVLASGGRDREAEAIYRQLAAQIKDGPKEYESPEVGVRVEYAKFLMARQRIQEAEQLLNAYLERHPKLPAGERYRLLWSLSDAAYAKHEYNRGNELRASANNGIQASAKHFSLPGEEIFRWAAAIASALAYRPAPPTTHPRGPNAQSPIAQSPVVQPPVVRAPVVQPASAQSTKAFELAMQALESTAKSDQWLGIPDQVRPLAAPLASGGAAALGKKLHLRAIAILETKTPDTVTPLLSELDDYRTFLMSPMGRPERWQEIATAIERYQTVLIASHGKNTGLMQRVLEMRISLAVSRKRYAKAIALSRARLAFLASTIGPDNPAYTLALVRFRELYQGMGDAEHALQLYDRLIRMADANGPEGGWAVGYRFDKAVYLAQLKRFDEAEHLANEAMEMGQHGLPREQAAWQFRRQQILQMKNPPQAVGFQDGVPAGKP
jgi:tetratricopeptide (TPR) repeat protein